MRKRGRAGRRGGGGNKGDLASLKAVKGVEYPAKFHGELFNYAFTKYASKTAKVFDPFMGSATAIRKALKAKKRAVGWDLNPISKVLALAMFSDKPSVLYELKKGFACSSRFENKELEKWYPPQNLELLKCLWGYWHEHININYEEFDAFLAAIPLMKLSRYLSFADSSLPKVYRSKKGIKRATSITPMKAVEYFKNAIKKTLEKYRIEMRIDKNLAKLAEIKTSWKNGNYLEIVNAVEMKLAEEVDLMLTSPPYLNSQEYIRSFKIDLFWINLT